MALSSGYPVFLPLPLPQSFAPYERDFNDQKRIIAKQEDPFAVPLRITLLVHSDTGIFIHLESEACSRAAKYQDKTAADSSSI